MNENNGNGLPEKNVSELVSIFNSEFFEEYNVRLVQGGEEPIYLPASKDVAFHQIIFSHDYFSSALHEISHWCVAGMARHDRIDFGYWYAADGRSQQEQHRFEQVEVKPQAMEWIFSVMAGHRFQLSADNLSNDTVYPKAFALNVYRQVIAYCEKGLPSRANKFLVALAKYYGLCEVLEASSFQLSDLRYPEK